MLRDNLGKYFTPEMDTNCAETTLLNASDFYHLGLSPKDAKIVGGFGGGCGCQNFCGALAGAIGAIGVRDIDTVAHKSPICRLRCKRMTEVFIERFGSEMCSVIKPNFDNCPDKCREVMRITADLLEQVMAEEIQA